MGRWRKSGGSRLVIAAAVGVLLAATLAARGQQGGDGDDESFLDRTEVSAVLVPVTVRDSRGRLVPTLDRKDFHLYVDDLEFPIESFWREAGLPLSVAFVLDTSGSMAGRRLAQARTVIEGFVKTLGPRDEVSLITFGGGAVKRRLAFGSDRSVLPKILDSIDGYGTTGLYDVLSIAPQIMDGAHNVRRATLLFTDGVDTASGMTAEQALTVLRQLADPLYAFGIEPPPRAAGEDAEPTYEDLLRAFSSASGGRYLGVPDVRRLPEVGARLRKELTTRYIIAFQPSRIGIIKWRDLRIGVDGHYEVSTREGYMGTLP